MAIRQSLSNILGELTLIDQLLDENMEVEDQLANIKANVEDALKELDDSEASKGYSASREADQS